MVAWLSMLRLTTLPVECQWEFKVAAYRSAQLAAYNSASSTDIYYGWGRRWDFMIEPDGWR